MTFNVVEEGLSAPHFLGDLTPANKDFSYPQSVQTPIIQQADQTYGKSSETLDSGIALRGIDQTVINNQTIQAYITQQPQVIPFIAGEDVVAGHTALLQLDGKTYNSEGNWLGIYQNSATAGSVVNVIVKGVATTVQTLTAGLTYYLQKVVGGSWGTTTDMPNGIYAPGCATIGTDIYVIGGDSNPPVTNYNRKFDTITQTWSLKAAYPVTVAYLSATAIGTKIYTAYGYDGTNVNAGFIRIYDSLLNTWASISVTYPGGQIAQMSNDGTYVYMSFTYTGGGVTFGTYRFNPADNSIISLTQPGAAFSQVSAINGDYWFILSLGIYRYHIPTDTWSTLAGSPSASSSSASASVGNNIYFPPASSNGLTAYNMITNTLTSLTASPGSYYHPGVASHGGKVYYMGGVGVDGYAKVHVYTLGNYSDLQTTGTVVAGLALNANQILLT